MSKHKLNNLSKKHLPTQITKEANQEKERNNYFFKKWRERTRKREVVNSKRREHAELNVIFSKFVMRNDEVMNPFTILA